MSVITFEDVMKLCNSGNLISIRYVNLDVKRKTGGKVKLIPQAKLIKADPKDEMKAPIEKNFSESKKKSPNHDEHFTRNFNVFANGVKTSTIKKIHLPLILEVDGKKMML